ncbi:MAG TPA: HlyD family type I secretion periplasmic adaptor subunit, partial [Colwellia sp.]|nr:HlyD family type I secretion periplasmic adaptor subunit [Colwellia sp.]
MTSLQVKQENAAHKAKKVVLLVFSLLITTVVWAYFATLQEVVVGLGNVVPAQAVQDIENIDGGILKEVLVTEGQLVRKGQKLIILEDIRFLAALSESAQEQSSLQLKLLRLSAELQTVKINNSDVIVKIKEIEQNNLSELAHQQLSYSYLSRVAQLNAQLAQNKEAIEQHQQAINEQKGNIKSFTKRLKLLKKEVDLTEEVVAMGAVSEMELLKLQRDHAIIEGDIERAKTVSLQQQSAKQQSKEERKAIAYEFLATARSEMNEV